MAVSVQLCASVVGASFSLCQQPPSTSAAAYLQEKEKWMKWIETDGMSFHSYHKSSCKKAP